MKNVPFLTTEQELRAHPRRWLVTGAAGFIGSNLVEYLLSQGQDVVGLDNFFSGKRKNVDEICAGAGAGKDRFRMIEGDIRDPKACAKACADRDFILHQAAIGSVPRSVGDPWTSHDSNVNGTLQILLAARDAKVKRVVYASSSSVYGDDPNIPKREASTGYLLSPYALTKKINEEYATLFGRIYGQETIGLRYFNVFGPRQDPEGPYAAVIPKWILQLLMGKTCEIFGDGKNSRDFCFVQNVIEMNILAATGTNPAAIGQIFNVGVTGRTSLNELFELLRARIALSVSAITAAKPIYRDARAGDVAHSQADISRSRELLGYNPRYLIGEGLDLTLEWYRKKDQFQD